MTSLKRRLLLGAGLWLAASLGAGGLVLHHAFQNAVEDGLRQRLGAHLLALIAQIDLADGQLVLGAPKGEPRFEQPYSGWYWQVADGAATRLRSRSLWDFTLPLSPPAEGGAIRHLSAAGPEGQILELAERDLILADDRPPLHVTVAADRREIADELSRFRLLLGLSLGGLGLGLMGAVWLQVGYGLRPLGLLAAELERLRQKGGRLSGPYPAEVAPLAEALNRVLDHDAQLVSRARAHLGNLAHGLKTPLAVMGAELSATSPDHAIMADQMARLSRLVDIHLARARAQAGDTPGLEPATPLATITTDLAQALGRIHAERRLTFTLAVPDAARMRAGADDLAEILGNLMDNACKWARSQVMVTAGAGWLRVDDDGPGLSPEQADQAMRRGARLDESVPGSGLGLHIVAELAGLLDLDLEFGRSDLGGLRVTLRQTADGSPDHPSSA